MPDPRPEASPAMRIQQFALCCALLACTAAGAGADDTGPAVFPGATIDFLLSAADEDALEDNRQRRGDSPFSHVRVSLSADIAVNDRLAVFNRTYLVPSSSTSSASFLRSYLRYNVVAGERAHLNIEIGKIPTPFGHFTERAYSDKNPLIGYPLMYHYPSSLRPNQLPEDNADLLSHRGQGSASRFTGYEGGGSSTSFRGLPMIYDSCWDFGGGIIGSLWRFEYSLALTQGTLSDPRAKTVDNNDGRQLAGRLGFVPFTGLLIQGSYARGPYLDRSVESHLNGADLEDFDQRLAGLAIDYGIRHLSLTSEIAFGAWDSPNIVDASGSAQDLDVIGFYTEAKYKLRPGLYAAARYSGLRYGDIDEGTGSGHSRSWDDDVERIEFGLGYQASDALIYKLVAQLNDSGRPAASSEHILAAQLTVVF